MHGFEVLILRGREEGDPRTPKTPSGNQHPNIYFLYFQNNWYFWYVARKFSSLYVSKFNISAADTKPWNNNNNEIIIFGICYLSTFVDFEC